MKFVVLSLVLVVCAVCVQSIDFNGIYPGTNWCGLRSRGEGLGKLKAVDACCKAQHQCPKKISSFSKNFCVINLTPAPWYLCSCMDTFHACLKGVEGAEKFHADKIGKFVFNSMNGIIKCFDIKGTCCRKHGWKTKKVLFTKLPYFTCIRRGENGVKKSTPTY